MLYGKISVCFLYKIGKVGEKYSSFLAVKQSIAAFNSESEATKATVLCVFRAHEALRTLMKLESHQMARTYYLISRDYLYLP
jgi:hypothetical protein